MCHNKNISNSKNEQRSPENSVIEFAKEISPGFNSDSCVECGFKCIEGSV